MKTPTHPLHLNKVLPYIKIIKKILSFHKYLMVKINV